MGSVRSPVGRCGAKTVPGKNWFAPNELLFRAKTPETNGGSTTNFSPSVPPDRPLVAPPVPIFELLQRNGLPEKHRHPFCVSSVNDTADSQSKDGDWARTDPAYS